MNIDVRPRTRCPRLGDGGSSVSSLLSPTVVVVGDRQAVGVGAPLGARKARALPSGGARTVRRSGKIPAAKGWSPRCGEGARMSTVAIACQGGGSHTAFTGGVLQRLLADGQHRILALSGRSGGGVCAPFAWDGPANR